MQLDENGDSEGNFSVLALVQTPHQVVHKSFNCSYQMRPVGQFYEHGGAIPVSEFIFICVLLSKSRLLLLFSFSFTVACSCEEVYIVCFALSPSLYEWMEISWLIFIFFN